MFLLLHGFLSCLVAKMDLPALVSRLNKAERLEGTSDTWGGSDIVMGSPRVGGSGLKPDELAEIVGGVC